jgi:uncharacterized Zn finger protein
MDRCVVFADLDAAIGLLLEHEGDFYKCRECGKSNRMKQVIRRHIEAIHIVTPGWRCLQCGKVSKTRNSLQMHRRYAHPAATK